MSDWLRELWRRLRFLFNRQQFESDLDEEMQLHKELRQQEYRNAGVDYDSARHNTQRQFGNDTLLKEVSREMWGWHSLETLLQDIRYGLRLLQRSPGFTIVAVLSLALGIGANTAMFSVINAVLLRPLPFRNADHIVAVREIPPGGGRFAVAPGNFMEWRHQSKTVDLAAYWTVPVNLTGLQEPERVRAARISANFFSVLGIGPIRGRNFMSEEDQRGRDHVAIVSYAFWQSRFSGDPGVLAKTLRLDSEIYTVVGIMPRGFDFPANSEVWVPIAFHADEQTNRDAHYIEAVGRLSDIASLDRARSEMSNVANRLALQYPATNKDWDVRLTPLLEDAVGNALTALWVLAGAVGLVLLIACANVANLMLARSAARQKEIAIRAALGAGRLRLIRQLLTESFILALIGSACGLLLAISILHTLIAFTPSHIPRLNEVAVDSRTLIFTLVVMLLTVVIFGSATAIQTLRIGLNQPLKEGGRRARSDRRGRAQSLLVSWEMALALMLLVGAGLLMKSFLRLQAASIGFDPTRVLTMSISLPEAKYPQPQQRGTFFQKVLERVAGLHGVRTAAAVGSLPFLESTSYSVFLEGRIIPGQGFGFRYYNISPGYFKAMGIRLLRGRWFTERDDQHAPPVAIISETAARRVFPNEDPLGKRFEITNERPILREIVGVVGDTKQFGRDDDAMKQVYEPYLQNPWSAMTLTIRTSDDPLSLANAVRGQVLAIDKDQPIANVQSMEGIVSRSVGDRRFSLLLFGIFAGIALLLAGIGTYGVVAYSVVQRRHEIGIRVALGAQRTDVLTLVLRQVGALAGIGIALGLAGSLALMRALNSQLYKVSSTDLTTFASVTILMITLAALASIFPAYHASRVDPMVAMRYE